MAVLGIADVPHFDLPFRLVGTSFGVEEQDSAEDVANCVECIIRTPYGFRDDNPSFGLDDPVFDYLPLNVEHIRAQIEEQEPRAKLIVNQTQDLNDTLVAVLNISIGGNQ